MPAIDMPQLWLQPKPAVIRPARGLWRPPVRHAMLPGITPVIGGRGKNFPQINGTDTTSLAGSSATSIDANLPTGLSAGELILLFVCASASASRTVNIPSGYTQLFNDIATGPVRRLCCFYKTATGAEGSTVTVSSSNSCFWVTIAYRISGWQGTPEAGTIATGNGNAQDPPSLSPSWGSDKALWIAVAAKGAGSATNFTAAPTNYSDMVQDGNTGGTNMCAMACATRELEASSDDPGPFTSSNNGSWGANTVAVRPA